LSANPGTAIASPSGFRPLAHTRPEPTNSHSSLTRTPQLPCTPHLHQKGDHR
jgi:hypothetical protein